MTIKPMMTNLGKRVDEHPRDVDSNKKSKEYKQKLERDETAGR